MAKIKWTPQSLEDIDTIADFIARDSSYYAGLFIVKVFEAVERLELFAESGGMVQEINLKEIRELVMGNYRIIYRVKDDIVEILTVYHSARLLNAKKIENLL